MEEGSALADQREADASAKSKSAMAHAREADAALQSLLVDLDEREAAVVRAINTVILEQVCALRAALSASSLQSMPAL